MLVYVPYLLHEALILPRADLLPGSALNFRLVVMLHGFPLLFGAGVAITLSFRVYHIIFYQTRKQKIAGPPFTPLLGLGFALAWGYGRLFCALLNGSPRCAPMAAGPWRPFSAAARARASESAVPDSPFRSTIPRG